MFYRLVLLVCFSLFLALPSGGIGAAVSAPKPLVNQLPPLEIIGNCPQIIEIISKIELVAKAPTRPTVVVTGETGTGKELVARMIHYASDRRDGPYRAENVANIPDSLAESILFGHERGSFSDAYKQKPGLFDEANGGTLFLDEIGELSKPLQAKILRVLAGDGFYRVGGNELLRPNTRVVVATNRDLKEEVRKGNFRQDLFYRLSVATIKLPPLRERKTDIPLLADFFARKINPVNPLTISPAALLTLQNHHWPGNIRELENAIERASIYVTGNTIEAEHIELDAKPSSILHSLVTAAEDWVATKNPARMYEATRDVQRQFVIWALDQSDNDIVVAAQRLNLTQFALKKKMREFGLSATRVNSD